MANVAFKKGLLNNLPSTYAEGTFYVTTDERALYLDVNDSSRIRLGDFQEFETLEALRANVNPSTAALYYVTSLNVLAKWNGSEYIQINLDSGMTSVEVVGTGNAVTAATYNPTNRKLTLTMGESFATQAYVGVIPNGEDGKAKAADIVEYINVKAEETLAAAQGGSSETAASVKLALDNYKEATDPRLEALEAVDHEHENADVLDGISEEKVAAWDAAEQNAKDYAKNYADGLAGNYDVAGAAAAVQGKLDEEVLRAKAAEEANAAAAKAADDKAVAAQDDVDALEALVGDVAEGKTVVQMIADAQTAATYDDGEVWAELGALGDAVDLLNDGSDVVGSVDYKIAQAVAAIIENPDETMNSINELVTWINGHAEDALELSNKVTANEEDIAALAELIGDEDVASQIEAAIAEALNVEGGDKYALAADLTAAIARIAAMEAKVSAWDAAEQNAKNYADEKIGELADDVDGFVGELDGKIGAVSERVLAIEGDYLKAVDKTELSDAIAAEIERAGNAEAQVLADAKAYADEKDGAMDTRVKVLEAIDHDAYIAADEVVLSGAKAYTDEQIAANALAWGSF